MLVISYPVNILWNLRSLARHRMDIPSRFYLTACGKIVGS